MIPFSKPRIVPVFYFKKFLKKRWIHITGWLIFIIYEAIIVGLIRGSFGKFSNYIIHYSFNISFFYFHAHLLLPYSLKKGKHTFWFVPLCILLEISLYIFIVSSLDEILAIDTNVLGIHVLVLDRTQLLGYLWRGLYFLIFSTGYFFLIQYLKERDERENEQKLNLEAIIEKSRIGKELAEAKNAFLLAQINPHFLFNTLNYLYYATYKSSPEGANGIMALAKIMRYSADGTNAKESIYVREEIEYVKTLIYLHQIRYENKIDFKLIFDDKVLEFKIIPMVLISIAENIFKHGDLKNNSSFPYIRLEIEKDDFLIIESGNQKKASSNSIGLSSGLNNIENRLNFAYGNLASIEYGVNEDLFFQIRVCIPKIMLAKSNKS
ncbi:sensor histidine kinase [Pedobacter sp. WC2501]|uniref:sensor histidine kinase n=1 Tax=Pedobacter sp. WC2501 TaxID=3461400 RepID=UPI004045AC2D